MANVADEHLGIDMAFDGDLMPIPTGDAQIVEGKTCLLQDLRHRLMTPKGGLWYDPSYGIDIYQYMHLEDTPINQLSLQQELQDAVEADPRIEPGSVTVLIVEWDLEKIKVQVSCRPIDGGTPINLVLGYSLTEITAEAIAIGL